MKNILFLLITAALVLSGCGSQQVVPRNSAEQYFQEGERFFESNLYEDAIASWEKVRDTYYSPELNMLAELKIAEAYYQAERYEEAASAYADYIQQHPNDDRVPRALYQLGLSHYQQILAPDRDQTATENALKVFQEYLQRYPEGQYTEEVGYLIQRCRNRLAEHQVYVARFYLKTDKYQAAIHRLEQALTVYPNYYYRDEAFYLLGKAYLESGEKEKAKDAFNMLFEQFPGSEFLLDAQKLLAESY